MALVRAWVLDAPGASEALSSTLAWVPSDEPMRARVRTVVEAKGEGDLARWRAAFARAEGKRDEARRALADAVSSGDRTAARPLLDAAPAWCSLVWRSPPENALTPAFVEAARVAPPPAGTNSVAGL